MSSSQIGHSRLKQYYVLRDHQEKNIGDWKKDSIVEIDPDIAVPYIGARILIPLASAIRTKIIPPVNPAAAKAAEEAAKKETTYNVVIDDANQPPQPSKVLAKNSLKEAVQAKKSTTSEATPESPVSSPETTSQPKELTAAEKAIQAKIAALKAKK